MIDDAAMERLRFDGRPPLHPASPDLADRVIAVGSASDELRMIAWRVGRVTELEVLSSSTRALPGSACGAA